MAHRMPEEDLPVSRFSKEQRKYFYDVAMAFVPLLVVAGVSIDQTVISAVSFFLATALGVGTSLLARSNAVELPRPGE